MCADAMRSHSLQEKDELDMMMFESDTKKDMAVEMRLVRMRCCWSRRINLSISKITDLTNWIEHGLSSILAN